MRAFASPDFILALLYAGLMLKLPNALVPEGTIRQVPGYKAMAHSPSGGSDSFVFVRRLRRLVHPR